jgi:hypothetical protein
LFSGAVLGSAFSAIGLIRTTIKGPRDWRTALLWFSWAAALAIAVGTVIENANAVEERQEELARSKK